MATAVEIMADVFRQSGWSVLARSELQASGMTFDFVCEGETAVAFCREVQVESLAEEAKRLTAEIAALTQRRSVGIKAWEGYLLMVCTGDLEPYERAVQTVQHDLSYCRKIVIRASDIESAHDSEKEATRLISFLFPLSVSTPIQPHDVRVSLVGRLEANGIDAELAADLVGSFDEASCECGDRLARFLRQRGEGHSE